MKLYYFARTSLNFLSIFTSAFLFLAASSFYSVANTKQNCAGENTANETSVCDSKFTVIAGLNRDFQKIYGVGSVTTISQPPLVIVPEVTLETPTSLNLEPNSSEKVNKIVRPLSPKSEKPVNNLDLLGVVSVLDQKGSKHLESCLKKLTHKTKEHHFPTFKKELEMLKEISTKRSGKKGLLQGILVRSPSKRECINYLDFILMAG